MDPSRWKNRFMQTQVFLSFLLASLKKLLLKGQYDEAKEKKIQMDDFRVEVYKSLEITDLLELQGGPRNH